jgi:hypothetical protein
MTLTDVTLAVLLILVIAAGMSGTPEREARLTPATPAAAQP